MDHNPYLPPTASVADIDVVAPTPPPWQMKLAVGLMWASMAISVLGLMLNPPKLDFHGDARTTMYVVMGVVYLVMFALMVALVVCVMRRHRWARIVYTALTSLSLLGAFTGLPASFAYTWPYRVLYLLSILVDAATVALLFTPETNAWFRQRPRA